MKKSVSPITAGIVIAIIALIAVIWLMRATDPTQTNVPTKMPSGPMVLPPSQQHRIPLASVLPPSQQGRAIHINPNYDSPVLEGLPQKTARP